MHADPRRRLPVKRHSPEAVHDPSSGPIAARLRKPCPPPGCSLRRMARPWIAAFRAYATAPFDGDAVGQV